MRDEFLTNLILNCDHDYQPEPRPYGYGDFDTEEVCQKCNHKEADNIRFSTWNGFGVLFKWAIKQEWWGDFSYAIGLQNGDPEVIWIDFIDPEVFADNIYTYLSTPEEESDE